MTFKAVPLTPSIGAVVKGPYLGGVPSETTIEKLRELLAQHLVLALPNQALTIDELESLAGRFGPLFLHHADEGVLYANENKTVLEMRKEPDGTRLFGGSDWHADVTFRRPEAYLSFLRAEILPDCGGDTAFASTILAWQSLTPAMQTLLRPLHAVHSYNGPGMPDHETETAVHPVVRIHPDTGEEGLYINKMFATRFEGMSATESRPLIEFLDRHMSQPQFTCRISWQPNQLTIWDNRFTLHYPINDFVGQRRLLYRCTAMLGPA
ncbi:MAG: TauD/TfdA family dioxygenase [Pseudomonadota bacterium]